MTLVDWLATIAVGVALPTLFWGIYWLVTIPARRRERKRWNLETDMMLAQAMRMSLTEFHDKFGRPTS